MGILSQELYFPCIGQDQGNFSARLFVVIAVFFFFFCLQRPRPSQTELSGHQAQQSPVTALRVVRLVFDFTFLIHTPPPYLHAFLLICRILPLLNTTSCVRITCPVMSGSLQSHGLQFTRPLCPWDFPGRNTGVDCLFLLQGNFLAQGSKLQSLTSPVPWQAGSLLSEPSETP